MPPLQIIVDIDQLSPPQRESLAGFMLAYPNSEGKAAEYAFDREDQSKAEPIPAAAFPVLNSEASVPPTPPAPASGEVSRAGPVLVIQAPPPVPNAPGVQLDKSGLPWDGRIHSPSKNTNADGTWRKKRAISDAFLQQVETELRSLMALPGPPVPPPPPAAASPVPAPPPAAVAPEMRQGFIDLVGATSAAIQAGKLSQDQLQRCLDAVGVGSIPLLGNRLDLVATVRSMVDGIVAGQST